MEVIDLDSLRIMKDGTTETLDFTAAELVVIHDYGSISWFIDVTELRNDSLLRHFSELTDIKVELTASTVNGRQLSGTAYFHPNVPASAAALRGEGRLHGYIEERLAPEPFTDEM